MFSVEMLHADSLDEATTLVASEHAAARALNPAIPADAGHPERCRRALAGLLADGHRGVVARSGERCLGVLCGKVVRPGVTYLPTHGVAIDPTVDDATSVVVALYAQLAPQLVTGGARQHHAAHVDFAPLGEAFSNLGFGRGAIYATRPARPRERDPEAEIRTAGRGDLDVIAGPSRPRATGSPAPSRSPSRRRRLRNATRGQETGAQHLPMGVPSRGGGGVRRTTDATSPRHSVLAEISR